MSQRKLSLLPEGAHEGCAFLNTSQRTACRHGEVPEVLCAKVGHRMILPVAPYVFRRIEFRRIRRQRCQDDSSVLFGQEIPHFAAAMNRQAIPNDEKLVPDLAFQVGKEVQHLRSTDCSRIQPEVELPPCDSGDGRQMLPVEVEFQLGRLPARCPCPADMGTFGNPALVYENDGSALADGFFLRAGHLYRFQRRTASSSRSTAFLQGRWQLQPRRRRTFQTWPGWYETPQVSRIAVATRGRVHRQLLYPWASGPSSNTRLICSCCRLLSRGLRPTRPADRKPTTPSFFSVLAHRDTDISLVPTRRATSAWLSPLRKSTAASLRRCSRARMALSSRLIPFGFPMPGKVAWADRNV